nr:ATP-dependent DNA helicase PIF1-like [Tanacetum cinerariifolium]GEY73256.1 ATP-dependent DNA helicase PIF1-like [Tanacetum cinerariifolium]
MADDNSQQLCLEEASVFQIALVIYANGKKIHEDDLMPQDFTYADVQDQTREITAEKSIVISEQDLNDIFNLNERQKTAFQTIIEKVYSNPSDSKLIIWEEAPMAKRSAIEALNNLLQDLMDSTELFGEKDDLVNIPACMLIEADPENDPLNSLIEAVYQNIQLESFTSGALNRTILTTTNVFVDEINDIMIGRFPGDEVESLALMKL